MCNLCHTPGTPPYHALHFPDNTREGQKYVDDKKITDHYAIIPTGHAVNSLSRISEMGQKVYDVIARRFLSIFMPPAVYLKIKLETQTKGEAFFANFKMLKDPGYLKVTGMGGQKKEAQLTEEQIHAISSLKKGMPLPVKDYTIKDGTTSAPKRYNSGSLILAMENAGQLIEDEELREQIKGSGIGTSATRAEIIKKLVRINKCFTVQRALTMRQMLESSIRMSRYMHYTIAEKKQSIWIAQREGRAKDSNDVTQDSVLKMLSMGGDGDIITNLQELNIVPLSISYEYDPCDFLKAQEFQ